MSPAPGVFELAIADALDPTPLVACRTKDLLVPADCEVVLEGEITEKTGAEGPFVDLTTTYDFVTPAAGAEDRLHYQPPATTFFRYYFLDNVSIDCLMGMPKEPSIFTLCQSAWYAVSMSY